MTSRILAALALLLAATACTPTIIPLTLRDPAEPLFVRVLEGTAAERTEALATLKKDHLESPWTTRARTVAELLRTRDTLAQKLKQVEQEKGTAQQERGTAQQERALCQQENQVLEQESARLREDLEKLKKLLINMEKRSSK